MQKKTHRTLLIVALAVVVVGAATAYVGWYYMMSPLSRAAEDTVIQLRPDEIPDSVAPRVARAACCDVRGLEWLMRRSDAFRPGNYVIRPDDSMRAIWNRLLAGGQTPVRVVVPAARTLDRVAGALGNKLMADSAALAAVLQTPAQMAMLIPNTYEVWWTITPENLLERLEKEHQLFWNADRVALAKQQGLQPDEVATLASIIDEETAHDDEKPLVARLYLNRLQRGIPLQADPTVKYAVGDPTLRRILYVHLTVESPYNTYLHTGLPPTPIRIPTRAAIEAVLHPAESDALYMCAREDFSGYHNFANNLSAHNANAQRYHDALNRRGIR